MGLGVFILELVQPLMEMIGEIMPGRIFPYFFRWENFQMALLAAIMVTIVAGLLGVFLIMGGSYLIDRHK